MLRIPIPRSNLMAAALVFMHAVAASCVLVFSPGLTWSLAGGTALAASLVYYLWRDALLLAPHSPVEMILRGDGACILLTRGGGEVQGRISGSTFVSTPLIAMNVRTESGKKRSVVLLPDSATAEDRRRLRVWLRHAVRLEGRDSVGL
jgi:hypothetical protein